MPTFTLSDFPEIWGLNVFTVLVAYVVLFGLSAFLARVTGKSLKDEWPKHWIALPFASIWAVPVFVFVIGQDRSLGPLLFHGPATSEMAPTYLAYMLVIGVFAVIFAVAMLAGGKKIMPERLALPSPPVGLALNPPCREDSRKIRSNQVPPHARISDQRPARGRDKNE